MKLTDNLLTSRFPPIYNEKEFWREVSKALDMREDWDVLKGEILLATEAGGFNSDRVNDLDDVDWCWFVTKFECIL